MKGITVVILITVTAIIFSIIMLFVSQRKHRELFNYPVKVPLFDGERVNYVNFDSAASTLPFNNIMCRLNKFIPYYSNIHRGAGYCSVVSTDLYDLSKERVKKFVNAPNDTSCIYTKNATESLNLLASIVKSDLLQHYSPNKNHILITAMEHHSNILPWFKLADEMTKEGKEVIVDVVNVDRNGFLDAIDLRSKLNDKVFIFSFTGASNVTGIRLPIKSLTNLARSVGVRWVTVDCSQLVSHKKVDMEDYGVDAIVFSAHKMYAPLGLGCLISKNNLLMSPIEPPLLQGGGQVELVTNLIKNDKSRIVVWKKNCSEEDIISFYEAGTPNLMGALALQFAIDELEKIGMENVEEHEMKLYRIAYNQLKDMDLVVVSPDPDSLPLGYECGGIMTFYSRFIHHNLISTSLSNDFGIGTRAGCFCAHLYIEQLLGLDDKTILGTANNVSSCDFTKMPGFVRASFALYNDKKEVEQFIESMRSITNDEVDLKKYNHNNGGFSCPSKKPNLVL